MLFKVFHTSGNSICLINYQGTFLRNNPERYYMAEEPVIRRNIDVRYRLEDAIMYDLEPLSFATNITKNNTSEPVLSTLTVEYTKSKTFTFSVSSSISSSVSSTISGGIPLVAEAEVTVEVGVSIETSFGVEHNEAETVSDSVQVTVPPNKRRGARKVAMRGKCDVPFSYQQVDVLANGERVVYNLSDGVFKGMNGYAFHTIVFDPDNLAVILERIPG
ncbi:uncharacterized protein LOC130805283 [Amaranthus tricolor]|uniref:uncharacterized protein LOC130805283 n=1 Tax=Amaranthus tricolor TaxID=29722 RepID=UPI002584F596|nr:uncharacterized protein LOC130805283 [Amaranthus tricolor]